MPIPKDERRRERRYRIFGQVKILFEDPLPVVVEAEMVDGSAGGCRVSHQSTRLVPGLEVRLQREGAERRARVVWTRLLDGRSLSGLLLL